MLTYEVHIALPMQILRCKPPSPWGLPKMQQQYCCKLRLIAPVLNVTSRL